MTVLAPSAAQVVAGIRDTTAERRVLCGVLKEADLVLPRLAEMGFAEDVFSEWRHLLVWRAAVELWNDGRDVDAYAVYWRLHAAGELPELGHRPAAWLAKVLDEDPTGAWAVPAAHRAMEVAQRRAAAHKAIEQLRDAMEGNGGVSL